jgi:hypothetical protein
MRRGEPHVVNARSQGIARTAARYLAAAALILGLVLVLRAYQGESENTAAFAKRAPRSRLGVSGSVRGLMPGVSTRIAVRLQNRYGFRVVVRSVRASVGKASSSCSGAHLFVSTYRGRMKIAARRARVLLLPIKLSARSPAACRGKRFPLRFVARATR